MMKYAHEFAKKKAEASWKLSLISKSNNLRHSAKEKTSQLEQVNKQIDKRVNALKKCLR